jgi:hypothetical protein
MTDQLSARRGSLPIPDRQHLGLLTYDAKDPDTSFPAIESVSPPEGAPNVLVILLDDVGFGAASALVVRRRLRSPSGCRLVVRRRLRSPSGCRLVA